MLSFILPLLAFSETRYQYPRFTKIFVGPETSQKEADEYYRVYTSDINKICTNQENEHNAYFVSFEDCVAELKSIDSFMYSEGNDLNKVISQVPISSEIVYIEGDNINDVDFNNLKAQSIAIISDNRDDDIISLNGAIKDKVSYLKIGNSKLKLTSDLNVHSFYFSGELVTDSKEIKTEFLITSNKNLIDQINFVHQLGYLYKFGYQVAEDIKINRIIYNNNGWSYEYENNDGRVSNRVSVSYSKADIFNLIIDHHKIEIVLDNNADIDTFKDINITLMDYDGAREPLGLGWNRYIGEIEITCTNWDKIDKEKRPKVNLIYDKEMFKYNDKGDLGLEVSVDTTYQYQLLNRGGGKNNNNNNKVGLIVGVVVAVVVVVAIIIVVVIIVIRKKRANQNSVSEGDNKEQ